MKGRYTPLLERHRALGAQMIEFGGWLMPLHYGSILAEHAAVRQAAGLFDVSHMGEFSVSGRDAAAALNTLLTNDIGTLRPGKAHYTLMLNEQGGVVDDLLVYRRGEDDFMLVVNAGNTEGDWVWINEHLPRAADADLVIRDLSAQTALLALQGPLALTIARRLTSFDLSSLAYFTAANMTLAGADVLVSRTGYTGEDGFEIYCDNRDAEPIWDALLDAGKQDGLKPVGLGARDTLRLEAALPLYGHELTAETTPLEAGLTFCYKPGKGDFIGRDAVEAQRQQGMTRRLAGLELTGRGIARAGCAVEQDGQSVGFVASGVFAPTLQKAVATAYLEKTAAVEGTVVDIDVRGRKIPARVVKTPFYKRQK